MGCGLERQKEFLKNGDPAQDIGEYQFEPVSYVKLLMEKYCLASKTIIWTHLTPILRVLRFAKD